MKRSLPALAVAMLLAGCQTVAAVSPASDLLSPQYPHAGSMDTTNAADLNWRTVFPDERLQALIEIALSDSRPLRLALLDADAAHAQLRGQRAGHFPQLGGVVSRTQNRPASPPAPDGTVTQAQGQLVLSAFELDLFGRLRAQSESAFQAYLAAGHGATAARLALSAAVADAFIATLSAQEREALSAATADDWRTSEDLIRRLHDAGQADASDLAAAEAQVRASEASLEAARREASIARNALSLVVGRPVPPELIKGAQLADGLVLTTLPVGIPSDLLTRRPDILQSEAALNASRADVRAARAAFFPSLSLTGQYGRASDALSDLFDGARVWSFTPQISAPIFQGGRLQAQLDLAAIRRNAAVAQYELTIQQAFSEVADGLAARETFDKQIKAQTKAVEASSRRAQLADTQFRAGASSRLELLDAQRQLYANRLVLLNARNAQISAAVNLYRALGGGPAAASSAPA